MKSIESMYKIGAGPSSSHTMGPERAALKLKEMYNNVKSVRCELYGSLALTGEGHLTDKIIIDTLKPIPCDIVFDLKTNLELHENTMRFFVTLEDGTEFVWTILSIGGGEIKIIELESEQANENVYEYNKFNDFKKYFDTPDEIIKYLYETEPNLHAHLVKVMNVMCASVDRGLKAEGILPGKIRLQRLAKKLFETAQDREDYLLSAFAQAVNEENASGGQIVTAPTCGACGIIPAVIYYYKNYKKTKKEKLINGLAIAGLLGALVRENASISGAEAGCQAEVGTATAMAAGMIAYLEGEDLEVIEKAASKGFEHQLGLTCDPVLGYVQVPCIQRNTVGVNKANLAYNIVKNVAGELVFDFDTMTLVMYETGKDLKMEYRETSLGGLAKYYGRASK